MGDRDAGPNARARDLLTRWVVQKSAAPPGPLRLVAKAGERVMGAFDPAPGEEPPAFADRVMAELEEDAEMLGEKQLYVIYLLYQEGGEGEGSGPAWRDDSSKVFRVLPAQPDAFDEERPEVSLLAQSHRIAEASQRFALSAVTAALAHSEQAETRAYLREQQFRDREWEDRQLIRGTLEHRVELEARREEAAAEREVMLQALSLVGGLAPGAISAFARSRRGGKVPKTPEHELLQDFLGTVRPDQFLQLSACLSDAQRIPLLAIVQGEVEPEMVPDAVRRLLADITEEQFTAILGVLDDEVQQKKFRQLFEVRKHVFDLRIKVGKMLDGAAAPNHAPGQLVAGESAPAPEPGPEEPKP
jgi:hypothetical protein